MSRRTLPILGLIAAGLWLAAPAAADCTKSFSKQGPTERLFCTYGGDPEADDESAQTRWKVPTGIERATFEVWGADGQQGARGGYVRATLSVAPGEVFGLAVVGFAFGGANWVVRDGARVLIARGAEGAEGNYIAPGAEDVRSEYPAASDPPYPGGAIEVTWIQPNPCVVPDVRGKRPKAARRILSAAHCDTGDVARRPSRPAMRGRVTKQTHRPGTVFARGTPVHLTVGRHP